MKDKNKWWLMKHGRQGGVLSIAVWCLPYPAERTEPVPGDWALFSCLKRLFLPPAFLSLVLHVVSQVYSLSLKGAIVTLSSLGSVT